MDMARVIYTPEGGSKRTWEIDLDNPPWDLTYNTERATGWPWLEFTEKLAGASAIAMRAMVWTLRKRDEPKLNIDAVQVTLAEFDVEDANPEPVDEPDDPESDEAPEDPKA